MNNYSSKAFIADIAGYLPERILDNTTLVKEFPEWSIDKIFSKTGISKRHIADKNETCSDMAVKAAENLFLKTEFDRSKIDYILLCTQSPDYFLPTTACLVQNRLGLSTQCGALDFNLGCSGYVYGLSLAKGLIETGQAENIILITSELYSKYISDKDKSVRTLFGDGATATLIKSVSSDIDHIGPFVFGTDGAGAENLIVPHGGSKFPIDDESHKITDHGENIRAPKHLYMNGAEILTFTMKTVPKSVQKLLEKSQLNVSDFDFVVFHQANQLILEMLRKKIGFKQNVFLSSYEKYGNTVSSTIPLGLEKAAFEHKFKNGDKILLVGFGVGYSWAGTVITWNES